MKNARLYAAFAVILPVSLGLGLVYLTIIGRIDAGAAVISTLGLAALIGVRRLRSKPTRRDASAGRAPVAA